jgi:predicted acetyltransferase
MLIVRTPTEGELERAAEVAAIAFEMPVSEWNESYAVRLKLHGLDFAIVAELDGCIVSSMMLIPEGMNFGDTALKSGSVAGVATIPEARRVGAAAAMMEHAVQRLKSWGAVGSPMWPFSFAYYRKFGWEMGAETRATVWPRNTEWLVETTEKIEPMAPGKPEDIISVWNVVQHHHRCSTVRTRVMWDNMLKAFAGVPEEGKPKRGGLVCKRDGKPVGYALYTVPVPVEGEPEKVLEVNELRALDARAEVALAKALPDIAPNEKILAHMPPHCRIRSFAKRPGDLEVNLGPLFGYRVTDPAQIFGLMSTQAPLPSLTWSVEDRLLGTKTWRVEFPGDGARVTEVKAHPTVTCSIETFSQIATGYLTPSVAFAAGLLRGEPRSVCAADQATAHWTAPFRSYCETG